jgi:lipid II:glycine glycyltransferase (peptidoglycan interpeptide bridge formation enzyme)
MKIINLDSHYTYEVDTLDKFAWTDLLKQFDDATIYQTWSYGVIRWGVKNISHLVLKKDEDICGIAQIITKKIPIIGGGIGYIPWGPLWQKKGEERNPEILQYLLKALKKEYVTRQKLMLRIMPNIIEDDNKTIGTILDDEGFTLVSNVSPYRTLLLDLSPPLEEIRKNLNQKWRNQLNRAEKNEIKVIERGSSELYDRFLQLQKEMLARKGYVPGVDYEEFGEIQKDLPESQKMKIMICEHDCEPIAATIVTALGNKGIYLLGASGDRGLQLKGSYLLQWQMIKWMKEEGYQQYDLGGINPHSNPGVYHFKSGIAGKSGKDVLHIGQFECCQRRASLFLVRIVERLKTRLAAMKSILSSK